MKTTKEPSKSAQYDAEEVPTETLDTESGTCQQCRPTFARCGVLLLFIAAIALFFAPWARASRDSMIPSELFYALVALSNDQQSSDTGKNSPAAAEESSATRKQDPESTPDSESVENQAGSESPQTDTDEHSATDSPVQKAKNIFLNTVASVTQDAREILPILPWLATFIYLPGLVICLIGVYISWRAEFSSTTTVGFLFCFLACLSLIVGWPHAYDVSLKEAVFGVAFQSSFHLTGWFYAALAVSLAGIVLSIRASRQQSSSKKTPDISD